MEGVGLGDLDASIWLELPHLEFFEFGLLFKNFDPQLLIFDFLSFSP